MPTAPSPPATPADAAERAVAAACDAEWIEPGVIRLALPTPTLPPATTTNHVLIGRRDAVIVDPSTPDAASRARLCHAVDGLSAHGWRFTGLLLSHHHHDHVGAANALRDQLRLPVLAHAATAARLGDAVTVDRHLAEGDVVGGGDAGGFRVLHLPGHAPGLVALVRDRGPYEGGAFVADMVAAEGTILVDPEDGDMGAYLASLERLRGLGLRWLLPSHGRVIHDADGVLAYYLAHRRAREARILAAIGDAWTTTDALLPATYGDVDRALWPIATRSLVAHLVHLHRRGAAERGRRTSGGGAAVEPVAAEAPSVGDACWRRAAIAAATES